MVVRPRFCALLCALSRKTPEVCVFRAAGLPARHKHHLRARSCRLVLCHAVPGAAPESLPVARITYLHPPLMPGIPAEEPDSAGQRKHVWLTCLHGYLLRYVA